VILPKGDPVRVGPHEPALLHYGAPRGGSSPDSHLSGPDLDSDAGAALDMKA
jgi:hypothetical protein